MQMQPPNGNLTVGQVVVIVSVDADAQVKATITATTTATATTTTKTTTKTATATINVIAQTLLSLLTAFASPVSDAISLFVSSLMHQLHPLVRPVELTWLRVPT